MAVVVEYQAWDSASYNWLDNTTSTSAPVQINDKLDAWVAAVNANASNTNKQITVEKDPSDSTSANFVGWVIKLDSTTTGAGPLYVRLYSSSATNVVFTASAGWTNDGTNGGYGAASGNTDSDTSISFATGGVTAEFSVAYEAANGVEFFCVGWRINNLSTQSDILLIFKDSNGEWAAVFYDTGTPVGSYYMPDTPTPSRNYDPITYSLGPVISGYLARLVVANNSTSTYLPAAGNFFTSFVTSASPAIFTPTTSNEYGYGRWADLVDGRKAVCMGQGPIWVVF